MKIYDVTLRDGSHAVDHKITSDQIRKYCQHVDLTGVDYVEVGHGIGIGASSLLIGRGALTDIEMLTIARHHLNRAKLSLHIVPGYGTIDDLSQALDAGVDAVRVASHCTEADITKKHIKYLSSRNVEVFGGLMMVHLATDEQLLVQCKKMKEYGVKCITLLDSAGNFTPARVKKLIQFLRENAKVEIGFHAHDNLGLSIGNSLAAIAGGATMLDASINGFGAGAGNTSLEQLAAAMELERASNKLKLPSILDLATVGQQLFPYDSVKNTDDIISGLAGVVSVFAKPVAAAARQYKVDPKEIYFELGRLKAIAGQEDLIIEVAQRISHDTGHDK